MLSDLTATLAELGDDRTTRAIVLTGAPPVFSAGADLGRGSDMPPPPGQFVRLFSRLAATLERLELPVVAALNGHAVGGGWALALGCDFRFAAESARCWVPEIDMGVALHPVLATPFVRLVGPARTREIAMEGRRYSAAEQHDASKAVNAMRRLVEVEKVPFTLTSYSAPTLAVQPIGAQSRVVMMNGGGQSDNLANKDYLYNNIPVVSNEVGVLCSWLTKDKKFKAAVMIVANDEAGRNAAKSFRERFTAGGGQGARRGADRARRQRLSRAARQAQGGRAAICCSSRRTAATWRSSPTRRASSGSPIPMAATSWVQIPEVLKSKGAQGMLTTRLPFNPDSPFARKFKERYKTDAGLLRGAVLQRRHASSRRPPRPQR